MVLRGEAFRAGEPVASGLEVAAPARLVSPHALEVQVTPELASLICDPGNPRHTTLRADLEVSFASLRGPRTTVNGRLEGVILDVTPELRSEAMLASLRAEGLRFASFLGAEIASSEEGLTIARVHEQSRASRAGLVAGDIVLELEGLVVHGLADFIPPPNTRNARVSLRRGLETTTASVDSAGFRYTSPASLANAVALVMAVVFGLGLLASPFGRLLGLLERRVVERLREVQPGRERALPPLRNLLRALAREVPTTLGRHLALIGVTTALVLISFGHVLVASEIDLPLLAVLTVTWLATVAIGGGDAQRGALGRLVSGLARALAVCVHQIPLLVALLLLLLETGSFRASDIVSSQGPWPWQWNAFSSPALALASLLALAAQVPLVRPVRAFSSGRILSRRERVLDVSQWAHDLVVCGLLAVCALGGWSGSASGSPLLETAGAAVLLAKSWALLLGIVFLRWALGATDVLKVARLSVAWFALPSLCLLAATFVLRRWSAGAIGGAFDQRGAWGLTAVALVGLAWIVLRIARQARQPVTELRVLPWL